MGILDGIVEWIAEQVMAGLDLVTTSVLGALGCDMAVFLRYFPAAETMYSVFVALAIGIILLNWVWQLFKNFGLGAGVEAEDPVLQTPGSQVPAFLQSICPCAGMAPLGRRSRQNTAARAKTGSCSKETGKAQSHQAGIPHG